QTHSYQQHSRHKGGDDQTIYSKFLNDSIDDNDKCSCWSSYLYPASSQNRNNQSGNNGGNQSFFRRNTGGDSKSNGKRKGDNSHNHSCHQVFSKLLTADSSF